MSDREAMERIVALLCETALNPTCWSSASVLIDEALGIYGTSMAYGAGSLHENIRIYSSGYFFRGQTNPELVREYFETYHARDERLPRLRRMPDSQLCHITDLYTEEELKTSAAYNEIIARFRGQNGINVRLDGPHGSRIIFHVHDPVDGNGWSAAKLDSIRHLLPHIRQSVIVQHELASARALGATLTGMLDATGLGIVQLDARGRIVVANDRARRVLRAGDGLFDEDGYLFARMAKDNDDLQRLLSRALPLFGPQGAAGSTLVRRSDGIPLVLHVNPVGRRETDSPVWPIAALVLVVDPATGVDIDPTTVAALLNLTAMESRVAVLLVRGMSVREIAAATGRKESTIRSHVKRVFAKHGLSRQAELVRLVRSLAAIQ